MKDRIDWLPDWITIAVKITDLIVSYSYSKRRDEFEHKCRDHIDIIGEIVFSDYKNIKKRGITKIFAAVNHDDEIEALDQTIYPYENDRFKGIPARKWEEERDIYKCVGYVSKDRSYIDTDDRFWDRYALMKMHNKDVFIVLDCKREKRGKPRVWSYRMESHFDIKDYE